LPNSAPFSHSGRRLISPDRHNAVSLGVRRLGSVADVDLGHTTHAAMLASNLIDRMG
jgi:hypothetical protein